MWTLLLALSAEAAPLLLPADEDGAAWQRAMALSGLEPGQSPPAAGAWAALLHDGESWRLELHTATDTRTVPVSAPTSEAGREAVAVLAASLLRPVHQGPALPDVPSASPPDIPPRTAGQKTSTASKPRQKAPSDVPVADVPTPPAAEPVRVLHLGLFNRPEPEVLDEAIDLQGQDDGVVSLPVRWAPWVRGSGGIAWRSGTALAPALSLAGGAEHGPFRAGIGAVFLPSMALPQLGPDRQLRSADGWVGAWLAPPASAGIGAILGISSREWIQSGDLVASNRIGFGGAEIEGRIPVGPLELSPIARITFDFAQTNVLVGDVPGADFAPVEACFEIALASRFDK